MKTTTDAAIKEDVLKFYKEQGLDAVARDVSVHFLDTGGQEKLES